MSVKLNKALLDVKITEAYLVNYFRVYDNTLPVHVRARTCKLRVSVFTHAMKTQLPSLQKLQSRGAKRMLNTFSAHKNALWQLTFTCWA